MRSRLNSRGAWVPAVDPLYAGGGVGPSIPFGAAVAAATGRQVRLIPCAFSGTRIAEWLPGWVPTTGGGVVRDQSDPAEYDPCLARTLALHTHIDGVIFFQGESDAIPPEWAGIRASQFGLFVTDIRRDLGEPRLSVVFAQIGSGHGMGHGTPSCTGYCSWETVRKQQALASVRVPHVQMIKTGDLPTASDHLHFTAAAYKVVGQRFAAAWLAGKARR